MSNQWCTGTVLIVSWGSPGVKSLVFHYLWSLWDPLSKLLMRKNAKWHIIRFHHNYCSQNTPTKCNLALQRPLSCGVLGSCSNVGGPCRNIQSHQMNPMLEMSNQWCTGTVLIVSWGSPGVKSLVFHYLWSLWDLLSKLLMRKNAKWHSIRFHHNFCSQHTPTKCNLALLRPLSCGVLGSCSNVGGPCRNIQSHQMNPMLEMSNQWCTGTVLIVSWGFPGVKSLVFHYLWSLWDPLPKLLMRKNAKWHNIRFHHNYCSQHTPTKCNLALLRPLSCGVWDLAAMLGDPAGTFNPIKWTQCWKWATNGAQEPY